FDMEVQPQLTLLQKTLLAIEGLGRQLYPDLDLWATAKPFIERWMRERVGPKALLKRFKNELPFVMEHFAELPRLTVSALKHAEQQTEQLAAQKKELVALRAEMTFQSRRNQYTLIGGLLILAFVLTQSDLLVHAEGWLKLPTLGWITLVGGLFLLYLGLRRR
ncbi:MAG: ubiquinone biosynthesis regulatory protein kinase UbiB, partial [Halothiobacillus sp.]|nr:ubiquinone biosynthesis regulatory protein kinase UbiB [Halothiobacillus sp.]